MSGIKQAIVQHENSKMALVVGVQLQPILQFKMAANQAFLKINKPKTIGFQSYPICMYIVTKFDGNWQKNEVCRAVTVLKWQILQFKMAAHWPIFKINKPKTEF